jgi:RimJ/RimL family protein N-acetyltransferase
VPRLVQPHIPKGSIAKLTQPHISLHDGFLLRPWEPTDADAAMAAFADADIQRWHSRSITSAEEAEEWIAAQQELWDSEAGVSWAITDEADDRVVGRVAIYLDLEHGRGEVSYWVMSSARRKGLAAGACTAATRWAHEMGVFRVELNHSTENPASGRVALACGFVEEGTRRSAFLQVDGWHDARLYSHLATDP